jgi:hypothetical protein
MAMTVCPTSLTPPRRNVCCAAVEAEQAAEQQQGDHSELDPLGEGGGRAANYAAKDIGGALVVGRADLIANPPLPPPCRR